VGKEKFLEGSWEGIPRNPRKGKENETKNGEENDVVPERNVDGKGGVA